MGTYYEVQGKLIATEKGNMFFKKCTTKAEALRYMMDEMDKFCKVNPELALIARKDAPSPNYRKSVYRCLESFFHKGRFRPEIIDYSDYEGMVRSFPPEYAHEEDAEYESGYEYRMDFIEHFEFYGSSITDYDRRMGFVFAVSPTGMFLQVLGTVWRDVRSICRFQICGDEYAFNYELREQMDNSERVSVHIRVVKRRGKNPLRIEGSAYSVMLLDMLLNEQNPITIEKAETDDDGCLQSQLNDALYEKINSEECISLSEYNLSEETIKRYITAIGKIGYCVQDDASIQREMNYAGAKPTPITWVKHKYYIPPLICRTDAALILQAVQESDVPDKVALAEKFTKESGCHRYSEGSDKEMDWPLPYTRDKGSKDRWKPSCYSLMIFNILRLADRILPVTSIKGDNLQILIAQHYGVEIQREALANNLSSMVVAGLPIKKVKGGYVFDREKVLSIADLDAIKECVAHSANLSDVTKALLIAKLEVKFPLGKY